MESRGPAKLGLLAAVWAATLPCLDAGRQAPLELYFEVKLLVRGHRWGRDLALDQWAGGRLLLELDGSAESCDGGVRLVLVRPLEDPWTFRWYPTRDDAKLGASLWIPEPAGDPYQALAARITPLALEKHRQWWDADRVVPEARDSPVWQRRADGFWADVHRQKADGRAPLHADPVFPFHVLGDPRGRVAFERCPDGRVPRQSIDQRMTEPWLTHGWKDWIEGRARPSGYGYWAARRPGWEPRVYAALATALELLDWPVDDHVSTRGLAARGVAVAGSLQPRARGVWRGLDGDQVELHFKNVDARGGERVTDSGDRLLDAPAGASYRVWRRAAVGSCERDEVQLWFAFADPSKLKLWIRVGFRPPEASPVTPVTPASGVSNAGPPRRVPRGSAP